MTLDALKTRCRIDENGCWIWLGPLNPKGYGKVGHLGKLAHRVAKELVVGRMRAGQQCDHVCRSRACINPHHIEIVSPKENMRRAVMANRHGFGQNNRRKTHCPQGHQYTPENTYLWQNGPSGPQRMCRTCNKERQRRRRDARNYAAAPQP